MDRINRIRKGSFIPQTRDNEVNPGTPLSAAALGISPLATNASPLDHARRAAGGMLRETIFCLQGTLASLLRNFNLTAKVTEVCHCISEYFHVNNEKLMKIAA
jgi:hypothetical protein